MKKMCSILCLLLLVACGSGSQPNDVLSAVSITAPDGFSVTCSTGFRRVVPHFCVPNSTEYAVYFTNHVLADHQLCKTWNITGIPSTSTLVVIHVKQVVTTSNAVNLKGSNVEFFPTASCIGSQLEYIVEHRVYEDTAKIAGSDLGVFNTDVTVPFHNGNVFIEPTYFQQTTNSVQGFLIQYILLGYYD